MSNHHIHSNGKRVGTDFAQTTMENLTRYLENDTTMSATEKVRLYASTAAYLGLPEDTEEQVILSREQYADYLAAQRLREWREKRDALNAPKPVEAEEEENAPILHFAAFFGWFGLLLFMLVVALVLFDYLMGGGR